MWSACRPTVSSSWTTRSLNARRDFASLWMVSASPMMAPTVMPRVQRGVGILEDDLHVAAERSQRGALRRVTFLPSNQISPELGSISRRMQRPVVDLPHPDSPTSPSVSPAAMSKLTPSTACTRSTSRENTPPLTAKCLRRSREQGSGLAPASPHSTHDLVPGVDLPQRRHRAQCRRRRRSGSAGEAAARRRLRAGWARRRRSPPVALCGAPRSTRGIERIRPCV